MRKLLPIILMIFMAACTVAPKQVPKNEIERALDGRKPPVNTEIETNEPEKSHYEVVERGNATTAKQLPSQLVEKDQSTGTKKGVEAKDKK